MDLRERLKAMGVQPRPPGLPTPPPQVGRDFDAPAPLERDLDHSAGLIPRPGPGRLTIDQALPGEWHQTPEGACYYVERRYALDTPRGSSVLGSLMHFQPRVLWDAGRAPAIRNLDARSLLFLDTETTGLSGGTGTYVFLVGVSFFAPSGDEVVLRQYFLSDISEERALLHSLNDLFSEFGAVVTFNGKSFDWPLLETRYTYSRLRCTLSNPPHLDMLGPSRRLWKNHLPSCSLETLETHVLGVRRHHDVPGWLIPSLYFQYLRAGHVGHVLPVFDHNEHDLLTLMALTGHVGRILDAPDEADLHAAELIGVARLYEDLGSFAESLRCYERGIRLHPSPELRSLAMRRLSLLYKHLQQRDEAVAIWRTLADEGTDLMFPYLELAKHFEHRARDYGTAIEYTVMAQTRALNAVESAELDHRLRRLQAKVTRAMSLPQAG
jgi:uncharacterized protein YprB with RNaseH-like and TPR domain